MGRAIFAEKLKTFQHSTPLFSESRRYSLQEIEVLEDWMRRTFESKSI
jgi:hypothetical protein